MSKDPDKTVIADHHDRFFIFSTGPECLETKIWVEVADANLRTIVQATLHGISSQEALSTSFAGKLGKLLTEFSERGAKAIKAGMKLRDQQRKERGL